MVNTRVGDDVVRKKLRLRVRLDYKGVNRPGRFFFGGKATDEVAEEIREQQVGLMRNIPMQGVTIEEVDMSADVYTVFDEVLNAQVAYAPVVFTLQADGLEDVLKFIVREEFRKIEIDDPDNLILTKADVERLLFKLGEEVKNYRLVLERKYSNR
ncbi:MAG: hypothetical protein ACOY4Q_09110 [Bacillota bacterium]